MKKILLLAILWLLPLAAAFAAPATPLVVPTLAVLQGYTATTMSLNPNMYLSGTSAGSTTGSAHYTWEGTYGGSPDGTNVIAPSDHPGVCTSGCMVIAKAPAAAGGSNTQIQYNNSGALGGISGATSNGTSVTLTSPTLVTPALGVATATSINKVAITAPATSATITVANGKTLTASNTLTFTGTDSSSVNFGAGGTVLYSGGSGFVSSIAGTANQITASASTGAVTLSLPNAITLPGTLTAISSDLKILGSSTGVTSLASANSGASNFVATIPAATDTIAELTQTQTLTNKTMSGASNTFSALALSSHATQAANTVVGNATGSSASPTALTMNSCSTAASALIWTTSTGFGCNTSITATSMPTTGLTGTLQAAQEPAHTGDVTNTSGSLAMTVGGIKGQSATTPTNWTPAYVGFTGTPTTQYATYTKLGSQVFIRLAINSNSGVFAVTAGTGDITGFPITQMSGTYGNCTASNVTTVAPYATGSIQGGAIFPPTISVAASQIVEIDCTYQTAL